MRNGSRFVAFAFAGVAAFLAIVGLRRRFRGHGGHCHGRFGGPERARRFATWRVDHILDRLGANEEQRRRAHELKDSLLDEAQGLKEKMREAKRDLTDQWRSDTPDAGRVHNLVDERIDGLRQFLHRVADAGLEVHRLLTSSQRRELLERGWRRCGDRC